LSISSNGSFTFSTPMEDGNSYAVSVGTQPTDPNQTCSVSNGTGVVNGADVTSVSVSCVTNTYSVGGAVSGLSGSGLVLRNNGGDPLSISGSGSFTFNTPLADGSSYSVTVATQPSGQTCSVSNGTGTVNGANVTTVSVTCGAKTFSIGGTVSGLSGNDLVLRNNGGDPLTLSSNGNFTFNTPLVDGSTYSVTVAIQPKGRTKYCSVAYGSGSVNGANITSVLVTCARDSYSVGGTVSGLSGSGLVLRNNGGDPLTISGNGGFAFKTPLADGSSYAVTVATQPSNQSCSVSNGSGTVTGSNVTSVAVSCVGDNQSYAIGGTVSNLGGSGLVLRNNGVDPLAISSNGSFSFSTPLADGSSYSVTVYSQPSGEECSVSNGEGVVSGEDITSVSVSCEVAQFEEDVIMEAGFETATTEGWSTTGSVVIDGILAVEQYSLRHGKGATSENSVSTTGYEGVTVAMQLAATSLKKDEGCFAEVSTDGGNTWMPVVSLNDGGDNGNFVSGLVSPPGADDNVEVKLRFRSSDGKGRGGYCYGDEVIVRGSLIGQ
jgi:hypothetical protein